MRTMFAAGFQPAKRAFFLGQALSQSERDHYLVALGRAVTEANEIDDWIKSHPEAKFKPPTQVSPATTTEGSVAMPPAATSEITVSPYFTKWVNFQPIRADMQKLKDRLANPDPTSWTSLSQEDHTTFGWVSVVDQIFAAFKADPANLTAGKWQGTVRQPDEATAAAAKPAAEQGITVPILNAQLPPTIVGIPTKTVLIGGGAVIGLAILVSLLR